MSAPRWRMPRWSLAALMLVLGALAAYSIWTDVAGRRSLDRVSQAVTVAGAYNEAATQFQQAQLAAVEFVSTRTPEARARFEERIQGILSQFLLIEQIGADKDRALIKKLVDEYGWGLDATRRLFESLETGEPFDGPLPSPTVVTAFYEALAQTAEARAADAFAAIDTNLAGSRDRLRLTFGIFAIGLAVAGGLVLSVRRNARREARVQGEMDRLRQTSLEDPLTRLGNQRAFDEELARAAAIAATHGTGLSLLVLDADDFGEYNAAAGHEAGDELLRLLGAAIAGACRVADRPYRLGGDSFAMILPDTDEAVAGGLAERLRQHIAALQTRVKVSIGITSVGSDEPDAALLKAQATAAMAEAKQLGGDCIVRFWQRADRAPVVFSSEKIRAVRRLIAEEAMSAAFQPIWTPGLERVLGWEGLARPRSLLGLSGPQEAFDIAQMLGHTHDLDALCRRTILREATRLDGSLLFLNLSPNAVAHPSFSAELLQTEARGAGLQPSRIVCEVTERAAVAPDILVERLMALRALGFRVALDDVGAGNSGLELLRRLPLDYVKIDRQVIAAALESPEGKGIVAAILAFAAEAGSAVIAEGIETREMLRSLRGLRMSASDTHGVRLSGMQGYALGRPQPWVLEQAS